MGATRGAGTVYSSKVPEFSPSFSLGFTLLLLSFQFL